MQISRLSAISEIVSSPATLVTLGYLAVETTQNTRAIEATSRQATLARDLEGLYLNVANPRLFLNFVNENMTDDETFQAYLSAITDPFTYDQPRK